MARKKAAAQRGRRRIEYSEEMIRDLVWAVIFIGGPRHEIARYLNKRWKERRKAYRIGSHKVYELFHEHARDHVSMKLRPDEEMGGRVAEHFAFEPEKIDVEMSADDLDFRRAPRGVPAAEDHREPRQRHHPPRNRRGDDHQGSSPGISHGCSPARTVCRRSSCTRSPRGSTWTRPTAIRWHSSASSTRSAPRVKFVYLPTPSLEEAQNPSRNMSEVDEAVLGNAHARKGEIDVIVGACATHDDPNSEHARIIRESGMLEEAERKGVVGDVLYCPFSKEGPVEFEHGRSVAKLFEFEELREFASTPGKSLVLVAGPTGSPARTASRGAAPADAEGGAARLDAHRDRPRDVQRAAERLTGGPAFVAPRSGSRRTP